MSAKHWLSLFNDALVAVIKFSELDELLWDTLIQIFFWEIENGQYPGWCNWYIIGWITVTDWLSLVQAHSHAISPASRALPNFSPGFSPEYPSPSSHSSDDSADVFVASSRYVEATPITRLGLLGAVWPGHSPGSAPRRTAGTPHSLSPGYGLSTSPCLCQLTLLKPYNWISHPKN